MKVRKKMIPFSESNINVSSLFKKDEINQRHIDYPKLSNKSFDEEYRTYAFKPILIEDDTSKTEVQYNFCTDTFCPNYGAKFEMLKSRGKKSSNNYVFGNAKDENSVILWSMWVQLLGQPIIIVAYSQIGL